MIENFNCVEMKHNSAEQIAKKLSGLSPQQELDFWKNTTREMINKKNKLKKKGAPTTGLQTEI